MVLDGQPVQQSGNRLVAGQSHFGRCPLVIRSKVLLLTGMPDNRLRPEEHHVICASQSYAWVVNKRRNGLSRQFHKRRVISNIRDDRVMQDASIRLSNNI